MTVKVLSLAVCLFPKVCPTDFLGPIELLSFISPEYLSQPAQSRSFSGSPSVAIDVTYLSVTRQPVKGTSGPSLVRDLSYTDVEDCKQFDIILVPGGIGTRPGVLPQTVVDFVKKQAPCAQYVLSICTGSEVLAIAGILDGHRATTNQSVFKAIKERHEHRNINWVPKARWVVDGHIWTSSGVTAGADMGYAFLQSLIGVADANIIRGIVELRIREQGDDEFAEFYGLV